MTQTPIVSAIYLFVADLAKSIRFYQLLGFEVERVGPMFARTSASNGVLIEFGTAELTKSYDPQWHPPGAPTKNTIGLQFGSADAVDETYRRMVQGGDVGHLAPCNPPWEARFAIIEDPDGNYIGLHGPRDRVADRWRELH